MNSITRVLIADGLAKDGLALLKNINQTEILAHDALDREELKKQLPQCDVLIVRSRTMVDRDLLEHAGRLKVVLRAGIGLDNVDIPAATERGVVVMNAPTGNIVTTAEHALAMLFAVSRHIAQADASVKQGKWEKKKFQGNEIRNKTLGLVGLGNIGKAVAQRALALGMKVIASDPFLTAEIAAQHNIQLVTLEDCLKESDYLSIHAPLTATTKNLINKDAIAKMKKKAYIINCARGGIVDEKALMEALDNKQLAGAALDVFETEPLPADSALLKRTDIILTPHLGASTDEAQTLVSLEVADQIKQYVESGVYKNAFNIPNVSPAQMTVLKPYLNLCEKLGSFIAQASSSKNVKRLKIQYEGMISTQPRDILTLSVLKGFLSCSVSTGVNMVNAKNLLKSRGIIVEESFSADSEDYSSLIQLTVEGDETYVCSGTLFGKDEPRMVRIDGFVIDAVPEGVILYTRNSDQPGVVGNLGAALGSDGVNIARMHLGRNEKKSEAISLINLDSAASQKTIDKLKQIPGMLSVQQIQL